jgi:hypothetical protein
MSKRTLTSSSSREDGNIEIMYLGKITLLVSSPMFVKLKLSLASRCILVLVVGPPGIKSKKSPLLNEIHGK